MQDCNHNIGYAYGWEGDFPLYVDNYIDKNYLDGRKRMAHIFKFCPECGINLEPVIKQLKKELCP